MARRNKLVRLDRAVVMVVAAACAALPGCGGQSELREDDSDSGDGGSSGTGGSPSAGTSGVGGHGGCFLDGNYYAYGESFPAGDDCNTCACVEEGTVTCTLLDCPLSCTFNGVTFADGSSFSVQGGCGTCSCENRNIACVSVPCPEGRCDMLWAWYNERVMFDAKRCDPTTGMACAILVNSTLPCGCQTYVYDDSDLGAWREEWEFLDCRSPAACVPCPSPPNSAFCSPEGTCIDVY